MKMKRGRCLAVVEVELESEIDESGPKSRKVRAVSESRWQSEVEFEDYVVGPKYRCCQREIREREKVESFSQ